MRVSDVIQEIEKDLIYFDQSGGGATFSGGEPLLQVEFLEALLIACQDHGIHTVVDTSGFVPFESFQKVLPFVDLFLYDVKIVDIKKHILHTGVPNHRILDNLTRLVNLDIRIIPRIPIIPGINDSDEDIQQSIEFLASLGAFIEVNLLPFHNTATHKYRRMRADYLLESVHPPTKEHMSKIAQEFQNHGFKVKIGG